MKSIKEIREAIDSGLDKLQTKAEAVAAQLNLSDDDLNARLAEQQEKLKEAAARLQTKLAEVDTGETMTKVQGAFEHLQVQLALGAAEGRDAFNVRKKEIESAIAQLNAELDAADAAEEREMAAEFDAVVEAYATQAAAVEAELQAMEEQYDEKA